MPLVLTGAILAAPILVLAIFRINAMLVFLSLCLGVVLVKFVGGEAASTVGILTSYGTSNESVISLFLLFLPAVLTAVFMIRSVRGRTKLFLNFLIAVAVGSLVLLLAEPYLADSLRQPLVTSPVWYHLQKLQVLVVALGAIFCLLYLWMQRPKHHAEDPKHK